MQLEIEWTLGAPVTACEHPQFSSREVLLSGVVFILHLCVQSAVESPPIGFCPFFQPAETFVIMTVSSCVWGIVPALASLSISYVGLLLSDPVSNRWTEDTVLWHAVGISPPGPNVAPAPSAEVSDGPVIPPSGHHLVPEGLMRGLIRCISVIGTHSGVHSTPPVPQPYPTTHTSPFFCMDIHSLLGINLLFPRAPDHPRNGPHCDLPGSNVSVCGV